VSCPSLPPPPPSLPSHHITRRAYSPIYPSLLLPLPSPPVSDIAKLVEAGISTCGMVTKVPLKTLLAIKGFSEAKVEKIRSSARKLTGGNTSTFKTGTEVREQRKRCIKITTGAKVG
jgi:hypothetical protein